MLWFKKKPASQAASASASSSTTSKSNGKLPANSTFSKNGATAASSAAPALIEREAELGRLMAAWRAAKQGHGSVVLVAGEAGHGKSSLVQAFLAAVESEDEDCKIARASCSAQTGRDEPFWPFADVMNQLVSAPTKTLAEDILDTVLDVAPSWVSIVPVAGDIVGAGLQTAKVVRDRTKSSPGPNPDKLLREYVGALENVCEKRPVLVVVDDLHWSDAGSIRLLSHISRNIADKRVLLVCAYRSTDIEVEGHPMRGLIAELLRYNNDAEIHLSALTPAGVAALIGRQYPSNKFPPSLADELHQRTGGAPLFVLESLRLMQTRGDIKRDEADGKWLLLRELNDEDLPRSVEAVIHKRLERLPDDLRRALALAAVQGTLFETEVLAYVLGMDETQVMRLLEPAERPHDIIDYAGDVEVGDEVTSRFRFNSTLFQRELLEALRGKQRMLAHRKTAEGIEKLWKAEADEYAAQLAAHYEKGRMWAKAADYMIMAAQRARRAGETENGIKRFEQAEKLLRRTADGPSIEQQIEIDEGLSYLYDLDSRYDKAEERIRHALALDAMHHRLDWRRQAMLQMRLANLFGDKGRHIEALLILQNVNAGLSKEAREHASSVEAFRLRAALAFALTQVGKDDEGIQLAGDSLKTLEAMPKAAHDRDEEDAWKMVEVELRSALAASYFGRGEYKKAIELAEDVLTVAEKLDLADTQMMVQDRLADMHLATGQYAKAEDYADRMLKTGRELSNESLMAMAHIIRARSLRLQDDNGGALRELDQAEKLVNEFQWFAERPQMMAIRAAALIGLQRLAEARALLDQADEIVNTSGIREWMAFVKMMHARYEVATHNNETAADMATEAARIFNEEWAYFEEAQAVRIIGRAHKQAGNASAAQHYYRQAIELFERIGNLAQAKMTKAEAGIA
jgi:tetratricopeptide (TPR) repeat protein